MLKRTSIIAVLGALTAACADRSLAPEQALLGCHVLQLSGSAQTPFRQALIRLSEEPDPRDMIGLPPIRRVTSADGDPTFEGTWSYLPGRPDSVLMALGVGLEVIRSTIGLQRIDLTVPRIAIYPAAEWFGSAQRSDDVRHWSTSAWLSRSGCAD